MKLDDLLNDEVRNNNYEVVLDLIKRGANVNYVNEVKSSPLYYSFVNNNCEIADLLISNGADVDVKYERGQTVLHFAASDKQYFELLKLFIKNTKDINIKDNFGNNALWTACHNTKLEMVELILANGGNPNSMNSIGEILVGKKKQPMGVSKSPYIAALEDNNEPLLALFEKYKKV